jgi:L-alanine-DL-glutamate epimerase-like enolase superfamily enzyme
VKTATVTRFGGRTRVGNAKTEWDAREGLVLTLRDEDGRVGQGEASPLPGWSRDTIDECAAELGAMRDPDHASLTCPAARFAVETALLDLRGQREGRSIAALLGAREGDELPIATLVDSLDAGRRAAARGVRTVKVKIGRDVDREIDLVRELRTLGLGVRADANGTLPEHDAPRALGRLATIGVEYLEEPCAHWIADSRVTLAADESLARCDDDLGALPLSYGVIILKPMALGGFTRCLALARAAAARGIGAVVAHLFDGPIALAACAELAIAIGAIAGARAAGVDRHGGLAAWPAVVVPQIGDARLRSTGPGLGVARLA